MRGDLSLLWRTRPCSDIGYLLQAQSDAYLLEDIEFAQSQGWSYGCDYKPVFKFTQPLSIAEIRADPYLENWNALRANFQKLSFPFELSVWTRVNRLLKSNNRGYAAALKEVSGRVSAAIQSEEDLEERIVGDPSVLRKFGYDLELWNDDETGAAGRQYICKGFGGRIDLLCVRKESHGGGVSKKKRFVVIEIKNVRAGATTLTQIFGYMNWVVREKAHGQPVEGLVISRGYDTRFRETKELSKYPIGQIDVDSLGL
jgi:hypothetical protein